MHADIHSAGRVRATVQNGQVQYSAQLVGLCQQQLSHVPSCLK